MISREGVSFPGDFLLPLTPNSPPGLQLSVPYTMASAVAVLASQCSVPTMDTGLVYSPESTIP